METTTSSTSQPTSHPTPLFRGVTPASAHDTSRMGTRFTDEDHELIVRLVREGADGPALARALKRTQTSAEQRARKLLPPGQRRCPIDRVLPSLAAAVAEEGYDWRTVIAQDDPPAPVRQVVRSGIEGLDDDQLVTCAHAVAVSPVALPLRDELVAEVNKRRLGHRVALEHSIYRRFTDQPNPHADEEISDGWCQAMGFTPGYRYSRYQEPEPWSRF